MDERIIIEHTRRWIADMVIGLNLCPFAGRVFQEDRIRYVVTAAEKERDLLRDLAAEMKTLAASSIDLVETTLLICPARRPTSSTLTICSTARNEPSLKRG